MALTEERFTLDGQPAAATVVAPSAGAWRRDRIKYAFLMPGVLWILVFTIFPLLFAARLSFFNYKLGTTERFIGFDNYVRAFGDERLWQALNITLRFVVLSVIATVLLGLLLALLFNRPMRGLPIFRAIFTMPLFVPAIAIAYLSLTIVHEQGPVNNLLRIFGMDHPIPFLSDPFWAFIAVTAVDVWQWTPFAFLVLLAGLQSLPEEIYEAAAMDTSSAWQTFRHITFPLLLPVIVTVAVLRSVEAFKVIDIPFALTNGGPGVSTRTYTFYTYVTGLKNFDLGYGTAIAILFMLLLIAISTVFFVRARHLYD